MFSDFDFSASQIKKESTTGPNDAYPELKADVNLFGANWVDAWFTKGELNSLNKTGPKYLWFCHWAYLLV